MAWKMAFVDASGNSNPDAYWRPAQVNISIADGNCHIIFYAYRNADAKADGKAPLVGATKDYLITGTEFATLYAQHIAPGGPNLFTMIYAYSLAHLDVSDGNGGFKSFFDGAEAA